ncbi:MAG: hypothetical protein KF716_03625 [Anaerolineae bacterium]|nr:hypothetical protein [Anaerolineae bacterium]
MKVSIVRLLIVLCVVMTSAFVRSTPASAQDSFVIFQDDFRNNDNGWEVVGGTDTSKLFVGDGVLRFSTEKEGYANWAVPDVTVPDDIDVQVTATVIDPDSSGNWNFALILRADTRDSDASFYHFGVGGDGSYEFSIRRKNPENYAENIKSGKISGFNVNRPIKLRVLAQGDTFAFFVNGKQVDTFKDSSVSTDADTEKYLGFMVGTYSGVERNEVEFTDLLVMSADSATVNNGGDPDALLNETFPDDNPNEWILGTFTNSKSSISDNTLTVQITKDNFFGYTWPKTKFPEDLDITVNVINPDPEAGDAWGYGIGYRGYDEDDEKTFYLFEVQGTGKFAVTAQKGGTVLDTLIKGTVSNFDGSAENVLRVVVRGNTHNFYVNGKKVGSAQDSTLDQKTDYYLLLEAGTFEGQNSISANFSNLVVKAP